MAPPRGSGAAAATVVVLPREIGDVRRCGRRRSCKLIVEDFQDELRMCNLLTCPRCVQRWGVWSWRLAREYCDCRQQFGEWARITWAHLGPVLFEYVDSGSQGKDVEEVDVVVTACGPRMSKVQKLKREICSVWLEKGGGNEVCQEASAVLSVGALCA